MTIEPAYLIILIEVVILESLAIAGFFLFRWWRKQQDIAVLEALISASENAATGRAQLLKGQLDASRQEEVSALMDAEILFQKRILATFWHQRILSLGRLPSWSNELLSPYHALVTSIQEQSKDSVQEVLEQSQQQIKTLDTELVQSRTELQENQEKLATQAEALSETQSALSEKTEKVESMEKEYVSAFHHQPDPNEEPTDSAATEQTTSDPVIPNQADEPFNEGAIVFEDAAEDLIDDTPQSETPETAPSDLGSE